MPERRVEKLKNYERKNTIRQAVGFLLSVFTFLLFFAFFGLFSLSVQRGERKSDSLCEAMTDQSNAEEKRIALTFDDGPNPDHTERLLEGLKKRKILATFFLLGAECEKYPGIVGKIAEDGHLIGVHAYEHVNLANLTDEAAIEQVDKTNRIIYELTGKYSEYIRPPYGCFKSNLDYETKMIEVLWDVDPLDWKTDNSDVIAARVIETVRENDIILLHDASDSSVNAAFKIIDVLSENGYTFVTVEDLLLE